MSQLSNIEKIRSLDVDDFIRFLQHCDFTGIYPIVEGHRFYTKEELEQWLKEEAE